MYIHFDVWISCLSTDLNLSKPSFKVQHFALCVSLLLVTAMEEIQCGGPRTNGSCY